MQHAYHALLMHPILNGSSYLHSLMMRCYRSCSGDHWRWYPTPQREVGWNHKGCLFANEQRSTDGLDFMLFICALRQFARVVFATSRILLPGSAGVSWLVDVVLLMSSVPATSLLKYNSCQDGWGLFGVRWKLWRLVVEVRTGICSFCTGQCGKAYIRSALI